MSKWFAVLLSLQVSTVHASLFGEENVPLFQLVVGQVQEIERLAELIGAAKDQVEANTVRLSDNQFEMMWDFV